MPFVPRPLVSAALCLTLACAAAGKPADTAADEAAIRAIDARWNEYLATQNDSAIGAIYADDAELLPPNMPRVTGAAAIRQFWAAIWPLKAKLELSPVTIVVSGDLAVEVGNWSWTAPTPSGDQKDNGKSIVHWRKAGGAWHVVHDIWNSDNPPPAAPSPAK